jgi:hypothetical protein
MPVICHKIGLTISVSSRQQSTWSTTLSETVTSNFQVLPQERCCGCCFPSDHLESWRPSPHTSEGSEPTAEGIRKYFTERGTLIVPLQYLYAVRRFISWPGYNGAATPGAVLGSSFRHTPRAMQSAVVLCAQTS